MIESVRWLKPAVAEVEPEEDEHLSVQEQLARLEFVAIAKK
jgi:hypothetical protein